MVDASRWFVIVQCDDGFSGQKPCTSILHCILDPPITLRWWKEECQLPLFIDDLDKHSWLLCWKYFYSNPTSFVVAHCDYGDGLAESHFRLITCTPIMNYILDMPNDEGKRNVVAKLLLPVPVILDKHCFYAGITFAVQQKCKSVKWKPHQAKVNPSTIVLIKRINGKKSLKRCISLHVEATAITIYNKWHIYIGSGTGIQDITRQWNQETMKCNLEHTLSFIFKFHPC